MWWSDRWLFVPRIFLPIHLMFNFHDSSFKWFLLIQFMSRWIRLCNLVLMFMFLWVSVGPTCSALPVNAKEIQDCPFQTETTVLSISDLIITFFWFHVKYCSFHVGTVLAEYLVFIWFLGTKWLWHAWELGVGSSFECTLISLILAHSSINRLNWLI